MAGYLAYIIPVDSDARPDNTLPQPPLGTWGGANQPFPTPPMAPGGPPLGTWGGGNVPMPSPPIYIPIVPPASGGEEPTHPIYIPVYPSHPIVLPPGGPPLGTWGGGNVPYPTPPIYIPPLPAEIAAAIQKKINDLVGNLPTNPNPEPTPV